MNIDELKVLDKKIKFLIFLNIIFSIINVLLVIFPLWHYYKLGFEFDLYFVVITIFNVIGFYISYVITDKLVYLKNKHRHFSEKLAQDESKNGN